MLVHDRRVDISAIAERIWYPVWDQELHLGHSVCTVRDALALGADDLDTATSLLSARLVAGDPSPAANLAAGAIGRWRKRAPQVLWQIADRVEQRHEKAGDNAFRPEPDLKEGRGGLRDVHALRWAEAAHEVLFDEDAAMLDEAYAILLDARVELQRLTGRPANVLASEHQPAVASAMGLSSPEELMARIAEAARTIAWTSDDAWRRLAVATQASRGRGIRRRIGPRGEAAAGAGLRVGNAEVVRGGGRRRRRSGPRAPCRRHRRASRRGHRAPLARTARGGSLPLARVVERRDAPRADRAPGLRSLGGPRDRRARPAGSVGMRAPRMATGAFPAAAGRLPRLHRRPASAGDGRRRVTARAAGAPGRTSC